MSGPTRLRELRRDLGLSQQQLAADVGLNVKTVITEIENGGRVPSFRIALRLEKRLDGAVRAIDLLEPEDAKLLREAIARGLPNPQPVDA